MSLSSVIKVTAFAALLATVSPVWAAEAVPQKPAAGAYLAADAAAAEDDYLNERPEDAYDPIEGFNRGVFAINKGVDYVILRPVTRVYQFVMPEYGQRRVSDFVTNFQAPTVFINSVLQGDPQNAFVTFFRFAFNSTLGVFGLFDIATPLGMPPRHDEDFGQTLASWGVGNGPYIVLPLFGPSTLRDTLGIPVDIISNPFLHMLKNNEFYKASIAGVIDTRSRFSKVIENTYDNTLDPYATFRSLYLQRRDAQILNKGLSAEERKSLGIRN